MNQTPQSETTPLDLAASLHSGGVAHAVLNEHGQLVSYNQCFQTLLNDAGRQYLHAAWADIPWVQQRPALSEALQNAKDKGFAQHLLRETDGSYLLHFCYSPAQTAITVVNLLTDKRPQTRADAKWIPTAGLIENLPEAVIIAEDLEKPLLYANTALSQLLHYSPDALLQLPFKALQSTVQFTEWKDRLEALVAGHVNKVRDVPLTDAGGRPVFVHIQRIDVASELNGAPYCLLLQDATRKRQNRLLLQLETSIFEMVSNAVDLKTVLTHVTKSIEHIMPDALTSIMLLQPDGKHVTNGAAPSLPASYVNAIEGQPIGPNAGSCGSAMYLQQPVIVDDISTDTRWDDYRQVALEYGLHACWSWPIKDTGGNIKGAFALYYRRPRAPLQHELDVIKRAAQLTTLVMERLQDQLDLAKAILQLSENEQHYRVLFDTSPLGMVAIVPGTLELLVNKRFQELTGYDNNAAQSLEDWWLMASPDASYREAVKKSWEQSLQVSIDTGQPGPSYDARFLCANGEFKHFRVQVVATEKFWISSFLDITEQVRQQERLAKQSSLQQLLMQLASRFINVPSEQLDYAINEMLSEVSSSLGTDRTVVYRYDFDHQVCKLTHEWCADDAMPCPNTSRTLSFTDMALYAVDLLSGRRTALVASRASTSNNDLKYWMNQLEIEAIAAVPLLQFGRSLGFIAFHSSQPNRQFDNNETALLWVMAEILSNAIAKIKSEEALRTSEKDFRALFNNMAQGVVYQDREGKIIKANHAAADILGMSYDELFGRTSLDPRWHAIKENGEDFSDDTHPAMVALRTGQPQENVMMGVFAPKQQEYRWLLVSAQPEFRPHETQAYRVFTTFTDVTQIKQLEKVLSATEQQYRILFENNPSPMWVYHPATMQIVRVNETAVKEYGYSREEFLAMKLTDIRPAEDVPQLIQSVNERPDGLKRSEGWRHRKKSGEIIFVEIISHTVDYNGEKHVLVLANDISQRKQIEAALQESENRYRSILDLSPAGIFVVKDKRIHFVNKTGLRLLGAHDANEILGYGIQKIVPPHQVPAANNRLARLEQGDSSDYPVDGELMRLDGTYVSVELTAGLMETTEGKVVQVIATDITDRKKYLETLEYQNKLLREIAWTQSHVVRAPLTRLLSLLPLHNKLSNDAAAQASNMQHIRNAAEELDRIITSIAERSFALTNLGQTQIGPLPTPALPMQPTRFQSMIVDDDLLIQQIHEMLVIDNGLDPHPLIFANGSTALAHIRNHDNENTSFLVLLDINMPVMNGWEFLEALGSSQLNSQVLVVVVTSSVDMADRLRAQRYAHVIDYVTKPVDDLVLDTIKGHHLLARFFPTAATA